MLTRWYTPRAALWANPWLRAAALTLYYLAILAGLVLLYGKQHYVTHPFIYQDF
jgi:hypothetical protein